MHDEFYAAETPHCERCGTVLRDADGGYECGYCGWRIEIPWVERPTEGDGIRGIGGS